MPDLSDLHPLDDLYEPGSRPYADAALVSIAISLKRIADALQGDGLLRYQRDLANRLRPAGEETP